ncbi:hypothetical protein MJO28_006564 [Puccinia striiformis f. sp. tritici]|uniref:Uncharacterized protein n=1 Tax=Puccinia striiformis f. sp. tritici TaxID=168172 RepID=A0ACC0EH85_9BASI|nr:hypothetical protein MJO28_006564 [Puccinia striiformis f. sp. tritici]
MSSVWGSLRGDEVLQVEPIRPTELSLKAHSHHKPIDVLLDYTLPLLLNYTLPHPYLPPSLQFHLCAPFKMNATVTDKAGNDWQTPLQSPTSIRAEPPSEHVGSSQDDDISDEEDADGSEEKEEEGSEDNASGGESEEVHTEIAENLDIPTYDHTSARLDALERRVTSIIGFADGVAWEGLPAVLLQLNRVESRVNKLYFRDDRVSNHEDFEAVNETLQQLMELEKSVRSHLCVFSEAARDGADEPCLDSLDELLKVLHRQIGPMLVSNRIKSFSTAQRIALITNCQQRIVDIRATELSYTDQVITAFGPRVMLEESVFKSEVANTLNNSPEYVALMVELNRISAMVHVMKMAGIMTDDGRVIHVDGTQAPQTVNGVAEIDAARIMIALRGLKSPNSGAGQQHKAADSQHEDSDESMASLPSGTFESFMRKGPVTRTASGSRGPVASSSRKRTSDEDASRSMRKRHSHSPDV